MHWKLLDYKLSSRAYKKINFDGLVKSPLFRHSHLGNDETLAKCSFYEPLNLDFFFVSRIILYKVEYSLS